MITKIYYIKLKSRLSVCLSVCIFGTLITQPCQHGLKRDLLEMKAVIVFEDHKVYFYKPIVPTVHRQECLEGEGVSSH